MNRFGFTNFGGADDAINFQITVARTFTADAISFVG